MMFKFKKKRKRRERTNQVLRDLHAQLAELLLIEPIDGQAKIEAGTLEESRLLLQRNINSNSDDLLEVYSHLETLRNHLQDFILESKKDMFFVYARYANKVLKSVLSKNYSDEKNRLETETQNFNTQIELEKLYREYLAVTDQLNSITSEVVTKSLDKNGAEYDIKSKRYSDLKKELDILQTNITEYEKGKSQNMYIYSLQRREETLKKAKAFQTMDLEEAVEFHEKIMMDTTGFNEQFKMFMEMEKDLAKSDEANKYEVVDHLAEAISNHKLVKTHKENPIEAMQEIDQMSTDDLTVQIEELQAIMAEINNKLTSQEDQLDDKLDKFYKNTHDNIKTTLNEIIESKSYKLIENYIGEGVTAAKKLIDMEPPQYNAAALLLRLEIESWFRYEKGIDFESLKYKDMFVIERFKQVFDNADANKLNTYWSLLNEFIHNYEEGIHIRYDNENADKRKDFLKIIDFLRQHNIDSQATPDGVLRLMQKESAFIDKKVNELELYGDKLEPYHESKKLLYAARRQNQRRQYLKKLGRKAPDVPFSNYAELLEHVKESKQKAEQA